MKDLLESDFEPYFDLIKEYSESEVVKKGPSAFIEYLCQCSVRYPRPCFELLKSSVYFDQPNHREGPYHGNEPVKALLSIYSQAAKKDKEFEADCLVLLDDMMRFPHYRQGIDKAFNELDK